MLLIRGTLPPRRLGAHHDVHSCIHHHLIPDFYERLSFMDDAGIDVAIASISAPEGDA
jgi:hypothetical protein